MIAFSCSCERSTKKTEVKSTEKSIPNPVLINFPLNGEMIDTSRQLESISYPLLVSSHDTFDYNILKPFEKFYVYPDTVAYSKSNNLEIIVDSGQPIASKFWEKMPIEFLLTYVDEDGKEIPRKPYEPPYETIMKFPVFVINSTDSSQIVEHHDGRMVMIQEALDKNGEWIGVEYFEFSGCGNSTGFNLIKPNEYLLFGINRYKGDFKTKFRVRLRTNGSTLFSNEYGSCPERKNAA